MIFDYTRSKSYWKFEENNEESQYLLISKFINIAYRSENVNTTGQHCVYYLDPDLAK